MTITSRQNVDWFAVQHLDIERLLAEWRWLCPEPMTLLARNLFGDLFLRDQAGEVFWLDVGIGKLTRVAGSETEFLQLAYIPEKREEWFTEESEQVCAGRGLKVNQDQCIGFSVPVMFSESGFPENPYVTGIYENVSFLGDLNRQVASLPDGAKVQLIVKD